MSTKELLQEAFFEERTLEEAERANVIVTEDLTSHVDDDPEWLNCESPMDKLMAAIERGERV